MKKKIVDKSPRAEMAASPRDFANKKKKKTVAPKTSMRPKLRPKKK